MSITYNDLISRAEQVRDESEIGANTATRVGQLLADIIQWCQDNNADLGDYLLNFTAHLNERGGILNWFQSRIVLLKTMGSAYDDVSVGSLSDGDVYYDSHGNWIREKQGSAAINGIHPSKGVFYVNLANQTAYQWNGTTFQVAIESGSGGGASTVTAFEGYEVVASVGDLPEQGNPTTGYIVGTHIYIYVGEGGDTADGKYQDLGELSVNPDIYQPLLTAGTGIAINGSQISVDAEVVQPATPDGTFTIRIGTNTYTINLNHTHEGMAKLEKHTPATLPDVEDMDEDTIYAEVEDGEVSVLYIGGVPFYGGGTSSGPVLRRPADGATIDMGQTTSGTVSQTINVKGKSLTQALTIELDGTGYSFGTTQPSGVTRDSATQLTVTAAAVNALNGVDIVVVYTGNDTDENAEGTLGITSSDNISTEATLVANKVTYEDLTGVKLTGTQWLQTDYYPNTNTEFDLVCKFEKNSNTEVTGHDGKYFLHCQTNSNTKFFAFMTAGVENDVRTAYSFLIRTEDVNPFAYHAWIDETSFCKKGTLHYKNGQSAGEVTFLGTSVTDVPRKTTAQLTPLYIGVAHLPSGTVIYDLFNLTIYELTIKENDVILKHYVPKMRNGVPGLYDTVNDTFIHSGSGTELEIVQ